MSDEIEEPLMEVVKTTGGKKNKMYDIMLKLKVDEDIYHIELEDMFKLNVGIIKDKDPIQIIKEKGKTYILCLYIDEKEPNLKEFQINCEKMFIRYYNRMVREKK